MSGVIVTTKLPPRPGCSSERTRSVTSSASELAAQSARSVTDELGELTFEEIRARASQPHGKRIVHLHDAVRAVGDDDQIEQRVERVLEQTPLVPHVLEELDILDAGRKLPPEISRQIEPLRIVQLVGDGAFDDERAEGPAPAAQRGDEDRLRRLAEDLRFLQTEASGRRLLRVAGGDTVRRRAVGRIG